MTPGSKIFGKIPFLRYTLAYATGIIISQLLSPKTCDSIALIVSIVILLALNIWIANKATYAKFGIIITTLFFVLSGILFTSLHAHSLFYDDMPVKGTYTGHIYDKNITTNNRYRYTVVCESAQHEDSAVYLSEKILITITDSASNSTLMPGHRILFDASLREVTHNNNPGDFDYRALLLKRGIRYQSTIWSEVHILPERKRTLRSIAFNFRNRLLQKYKDAGISGDEFAVLAALTLGDKNYLSSELRQSFASSGAMHVLAVSGLHVGIIYMILNMMISPFFRSSRIKVFKMLILIALLWSYAFISGLSPSVMRASTMFTFVIIGENLKRKTNIYNTLAVSAFVLMLSNPLIIYEIGFQLSYAAVTAIVFFQPRIAALIPLKNKILKYLWELFAVSVAAQIGTFVISIYYFNQFPVYFWISNYIVIPAAAALLYGALFFFILNFIPFLSVFIARVIEKITLLMNLGVKNVEQLPGSLIQNIWIDDATMIFLFAAVISIGWFTSEKQFRLLLSTLVIFILLSGNAIFNAVKINKQSKLVFFNTWNSPLMGIASGQTFYYYHTNDSISPYTQNLVNNASQFFKTTKTKKIIPLNESKQSATLYKEHILYHNLIIKINHANERLTESEKNFDIYWNTNDSEITIHSTNLFIITKLSNGRKEKPKQDSKTTFETKQGALIITENPTNINR